MTFRVLVTGFGPFPGVLDNPSATLARALEGRRVERDGVSATVASAVLDVAWADGVSKSGVPVRDAAAALREAVARVEPHLLLSIGVMPREAHKLRIETRACDARSQRIDVRAELPAAARAYPSEPAVLTPNAPADAIARELEARGHAVELSEDAGKYLCEAIAYEGARLAGAARSSVLVSAFLHVPNGRAVEPLIDAATIVIERCLVELAAREPRG